MMKGQLKATKRISKTKQGKIIMVIFTLKKKKKKGHLIEVFENESSVVQFLVSVINHLSRI